MALVVGLRTVPPADVAHLRSYRYHGEDRNIVFLIYPNNEFRSLINKYILGDVYDWLVANVLPGWLAPNVLTISGPVFAIVAHFIAMILSPTWNSQLPRWFSNFFT